MENNALIRTRTLTQKGNGVLMSITIMNLQRQIVASSHFDVRAEGLLLGLTTGISGAEVIQAALPHSNHQRVSQAFLYHGQDLVKGNMVLTHLGKQTIR